MKNDNIVVFLRVIIVGLIIYIVLWSWNYLSSQLDSTFFALLLTIPLTVIIFWILRMTLGLTILIFVSLFSNNR